MITPGGGLTASALWTALKAGTPVNARLTFADGTVLTDADFSLDGGITISDIFNSDTNLVFGKAVCKQFKASIMNSSRLTDLPWADEFTVEFGVTISNTDYWTTVGTFSGEKPNNVTTTEIIDFTAYDRMMLFDVLADDFVDSLTYPKTLEDIYHELCDYVGIQYMAGDELPNAFARSFNDAPADMKGYTCRDILSWIAEACGCYAKINANGKCQLRWFTDNTAHSITGSEQFDYEAGDINDGLIWNEADQLTWNQIGRMTWDDVCGYEEAYGIDQLLVKQLDNDMDINFPAALGGNVYMIVDNPFLNVVTEHDITNYINPLFNRVRTFGGHLPIKLDCKGDFTVEAGDTVSVIIGNNTLTVPIFVKEMKWSVVCEDSYETTGQKDRPAYTTEKNKQKVLNSKEIKLIVEQNYYKRFTGIVIDEDGVKISGGRYIDIVAGSSLDIESDGAMNIKSGADMNIASGGNLKVKSGGNFSIESGGNIDINGSGNLKLSGSVVEIKSGSTFDVDATNFKINSANKLFKAGTWELSSSGIFGKMNGTNPECLEFSILGKNYEIAMEFYDSSIASLEYIYFRPDEVNGSHIVFAYPSDNYGLTLGLNGHWLNEIYVQFINNTTMYGGTVYYTTLTQYSSRDVKHDITPFSSKGEQIDALTPVTFVYDNDENEQTRYGLIYEDTIGIMPEICTGDESNKAINYVELIPVLLKEIQDLRSRVKELEEREED